MNNKDEAIKVSICCITFNHEKYIRDALDSFLKQKTNFKYEIIIHDDASTDKTVDILKEYKDKYPEIIKLIIQEKNQYSLGKKILPNVFNVARGKYIAICEGDDYWTDENKLQIQLDYMEDHEECTLCFHSFDNVDKDKNIIESVERYKNNTKCSPRDFILGGGGFCATASLMIPSKLLKNLPEYYYSYIVEDFPIQLYAMSSGYAYYINKNMSAYRVGADGSWTSTFNNGEKEEIRLRYIKYNEDRIDMIKKFNESTDYKYDDIVNELIIRSKISIDILNNNYSILRNKISRKYLRSLDNKTQIVYLLRAYLPHFASIMKKVKGYIRG